MLSQPVSQAPSHELLKTMEVQPELAHEPPLSHPPSHPPSHDASLSHEAV